MSAMTRAMTEREFRAKVRAAFPHVTVSIRTVSFMDLARARAKCLTITNDHDRESVTINAWAREAGIVPDGNARIRDSKETTA